MSFGDVVTTEVIAIFGVLLLIGTIIPGVRLYWPRHADPASRSDLGVALMGGALIAFAVLALQLMIQIRAQLDADARQQEAERQALLLVLGRSPDLSGLDLQEEDLNDAYLNSKVLRGANLAGAEMNNASLQDANLVAAHMRGAELEEARLDRADLRYADLRGAKLIGASLSSAKLDGAALAPAWDGDKLVGVDLSGANLSNAWARADLRRATLAGARLVGTRLSPANLQRSDLRGADLEFADLRGANLIAADLTGAVNLDRAKDLSYVKHSRDTKWPKGYLWENQDPSKCALPLCTLPPKSTPVNDFPPQLDAMRQELVTATTTRTKGCLTGWLVDERPTAIEAHAPGDRAVFEIGTALVGEMTAKKWARSYGNRDVQPIAAIRANGASSTYAERFKVNVDGRPLESVTVYFVDGSRGFRIAGTAPRDIFDLFQRDFLKLFRAVGINGDVFPSLRGDKAGCAI